MRNIPAQLILVVIVVSIVAITNLVPSRCISQQLANYNTADDGYVAPLVPSVHQQGFVFLLRSDLRELRSLPGPDHIVDNAAITGARVSYNSIACQMSSATLAANHLPKCVDWRDQ